MKLIIFTEFIFTCMNLGAFGSWANFSAFPLCSKYTFFFLSNWSRFFSCLVIISSVSSTEFELISRVDLAIDSSSHSKNGVSSSVYWKWRRKYYFSCWILEFDIWNWWFDSDLKQVHGNQSTSLKMWVNIIVFLFTFTLLQFYWFIWNKISWRNNFLMWLVDLSRWMIESRIES